MSNTKRKDLKVGNFIEPKGFPLGEIMTEEECSLQPLVDGKRRKRWKCWTVRTKARRPLHKYLIVDWGKDGIILFKKSKLKFAPKSAKIWVERSGLEEMENITGNGPDAYIYSMLVFILDPRSKTPKKFYAIERLRNDQIFRYEGVRIDV